MCHILFLILLFGRHIPCFLASLPDVLELQNANACHLKISAIILSAWRNHLDNQLDVELLDLHDRCYAKQAVVDNAINTRYRELLKAKCKEDMEDFDKNPAVNVLREKISSLSGKVKEYKANLDMMLLESQKWVDYQVSHSTLYSKVASLETKKVMLEATKPSLHQELENARLYMVEVVSKVVPYVATELVQSDDMGRLVAMLVSSAIFYRRCHAFEEVANMKEPFDITKENGYRSSYKQEHTKAGNEFVTTTFPYLADVVAHPHALVEVLLSKKPYVLQCSVPTRTHMPASSIPSQKASPLPALMSPLSQITHAAALVSKTQSPPPAQSRPPCWC
nr:hypothetical protein [Tanacetum cinerariifolium]